ncbi:glycosyltransferase family 2 protein [Nonlabens agnitus]|uniref:Glycosyltransferase 2-like domain-containing protein n=1 Tax=Nonlabens agnitus TaxID=870484 RepID=A0A2S9WUT2_9FLAO|nr:glycosyltransferase [Nonlabens agnitus]PRP67237.1 hypothetical protein BST86_09050 [Nonlabens agnitus]
MNILIVIPLYNKADTIKRAVESALGQTVACDILVVDDGSTDASLANLSEIKNDRITVIQQSNHGVSHARNIGIKNAKKNEYDFVAFLDADDYWMPDHLTEISSCMAAFPSAQIIANNYKLKFSPKKFSKTKFSNWNADEPKILDSFFDYNGLNSILSSSSFAMSVQNEDPLFYEENLTHTEDTDFMIRAGLEKKIVFNPTTTVIIDKTGKNRSGNVPLKQRTITDYDQYEEKYPEVPGLKKFLDINRFSVAIGYRLQNDIKNAALYQHKIDTNNLTGKQQNLLTMSSRQLKALKRTQRILGNLGFRLRTGR